MQSPHEGLSTESLLGPASGLPPLPLPPNFNTNSPTALASATPLPPTPLAKDGTSRVNSPAAHYPQEKRAGPSEYYFSPRAQTMPGSYSPAADPRAQTPSTTVPYTTTTATIISTTPQKRASGNSLRSFLSGFRRSSGKDLPNPRNSSDTSLSGNGAFTPGTSRPNTGMQTPPQRPSTPGESSIADSTSRPSLRSKMSGPFSSRRKSSLSNMLGQDDPREGSQYTSSPRSTGNDIYNTASAENSFSPSSPSPPQLYSDSPTYEGSTTSTPSLLRARRKISSTLFSHRKSSSLRTELDGQYPPVSSAFSPTSSDAPSSAAILSPQSSSHSPTTSFKRARSPTLGDMDDLSMSPPPSTLRKRKSGLSGFWRRGSKLGAIAAGDNHTVAEQEIAKQQQAPPRYQQPSTTTDSTYRRRDLDEEIEPRFSTNSQSQPRSMDQEMITSTISRSPSPPPVLPELKLGGDLGLGKGDSGIFMDEGLFGRIG